MAGLGFGSMSFLLRMFTLGIISAVASIIVKIMGKTEVAHIIDILTVVVSLGVAMGAIGVLMNQVITTFGVY